METYREFLAFKRSDNVIRTGKNEYKTQCSQYGKGFTRKELYIYFKKEYK